MGLRVSSKVSSIWIALTMADSFFSLWKIFDRSCSIISCLGKQINSQVLIVTPINSNVREEEHGTSKASTLKELNPTWAYLFHLTIFNF